MDQPIDPIHEQGTHHWLLTLDGIGSRSGTCTPVLDESRYDLYLRIRALILDEAGLADGPVPVTLFFDLQANTITGESNAEAEEGLARGQANGPLPRHG